MLLHQAGRMDAGFALTIYASAGNTQLCNHMSSSCSCQACEACTCRHCWLPAAHWCSWAAESSLWCQRRGSPLCPGRPPCHYTFPCENFAPSAIRFNGHLGNQPSALVLELHPQDMVAPYVVPSCSFSIERLGCAATAVSCNSPGETLCQHALQRQE